MIIINNDKDRIGLQRWGRGRITPERMRRRHEVKPEKTHKQRE